MSEAANSPAAVARNAHSVAPGSEQLSCCLQAVVAKEHDVSGPALTFVGLVGLEARAQGVLHAASHQQPERKGEGCFLCVCVLFVCVCVCCFCVRATSSLRGRGRGRGGAWGEA